MNEDIIIERFLEEIEDFLYLDYKISDKQMAEMLLIVLEKEYDI
ncbi:MAG: hypothetical protein RBQ95_01420 [Paracholeplasma sp.]|nr:hypothetical protein [Paracholeplasma sp.]MDY3195492.1 hypothetical protein [Paracholeplasma sp.]